jgi:transcriptional regulator with XRE-family HTH domain
MEPKEIIKSAREKKGWTQDQVARELKIELRTYQRYEEGKFPKYKGDIVRNIDSLLGTKVYDIIYDNKLHPLNGSEQTMNPVEEKYLALLEKTIADKDKNISEKEADLVALRSAINGINEVKGKIEKLEPIVYDLSNRLEDAEANVGDLREFVIRQIAKIRKETTAKVAAELGTVSVELLRQNQKKGIPPG